MSNKHKHVALHMIMGQTLTSF